MKIAFIVGEFPALSETFILNQITGLIDRGNDVDIFAYKKRNEIKVHPDVENYDLLAKTYYRNMPKNKLLRVYKAICLVITKFSKNPYAILRAINIFKYGKRALSLELLFAIIPFLDKSPYDIVHCHFGPNGSLGVLLKEIGVFNCKVITTFHGFDMSAHINQNDNDTYKYLFEKGDLFLPISNYWKEKLVKLGCEKSKIIVHHMGINTVKFKLKIRKHELTEEFRILSVARLVEKKGIDYAIKSVKNLVNKRFQIRYIIIGNGPQYQELKELISSLNLAKFVFLVGVKNQEEIIDIMDGSHVFLAPSVTSTQGDKEGIPVALMEAMAMGLPVVSTWHSGIPELVEEGKSGFLVPERDVEALAEKLEYLIRHPETWSKMGQAGRTFVEEKFDIFKLNNQLMDIYSNLLEE